MKCKSEDHMRLVAEAKSNMPPEDMIVEIGVRFKVMSEPTRIKILLALQAGEMCVEHITEVVKGTQSAVSHQLKILRDNKIIKSRRQGQNVLYSISDWHVLTMLCAAREHTAC